MVLILLRVRLLPHSIIPINICMIFLLYQLHIIFTQPFINISKVLLHATGDHMTQNCHYSNNLNHYVSPDLELSLGYLVSRALAYKPNGHGFKPGSCHFVSLGKKFNSYCQHVVCESWSMWSGICDTNISGNFKVTIKENKWQTL